MDHRLPCLSNSGLIKRAFLYLYGLHIWCHYHVVDLGNHYYYAIIMQEESMRVTLRHSTDTCICCCLCLCLCLCLFAAASASYSDHNSWSYLPLSQVLVLSGPLSQVLVLSDVKSFLHHLVHFLNDHVCQIQYTPSKLEERSNSAKIKLQ
jgi:hypothetical protein